MKSHEEVCKQLREIHEIKDRKYGSSFHETFKTFGIVSPLTRISDKLSRCVNIVKGIEDNESLEDNLLDLANYAIMTIMEIGIAEVCSGDVGYSSEELEDEEDEGQLVRQLEDQLSELTKPELHQIASKLDLTFSKKLGKDELILHLLEDASIEDLQYILDEMDEEDETL